MNPSLYFWLSAACVAGVAVAGATPTTHKAAPHLWPSVVGLGGVVAALLAVGVVSGTLMRHVIQVMPPAVALILVGIGSPYGRAAALPTLTFWAGLMVIIWLYLLGLSRWIAGRFTAVEVALTVTIALACLAGLVGGARPTANLGRGRRAATALVFGLLQLGALWLSMQPLALLR